MDVGRLTNRRALAYPLSPQSSQLSMLTTIISHYIERLWNPNPGNATAKSVCIHTLFSMRGARLHVNLLLIGWI